MRPRKSPTSSASFGKGHPRLPNARRKPSSLKALRMDQVRGVAMAVTGTVNSSVSFLVQFIFPWQLNNTGAASTFLGYALFALLFLGFECFGIWAFVTMALLSAVAVLLGVAQVSRQVDQARDHLRSGDRLVRVVQHGVFERLAELLALHEVRALGDADGEGMRRIQNGGDVRLAQCLPHAV